MATPRAKRPPSMLGAPRSVAWITAEKYERMWLVYWENPTIEAIAVCCNVGRDKARQAVHEGWPDLGFPPLAHRFKQTALKTIEASDQRVTATQRRIASQAALIREQAYTLLVAGLENEVKALQADGGRMTPAEATQLFGLYEKAVRLGEFASGRAEDRKTPATVVVPMQDLLAAFDAAIDVEERLRGRQYTADPIGLPEASGSISEGVVEGDLVIDPGDGFDS